MPGPSGPRADEGQGPERPRNSLRVGAKLPEAAGESVSRAKASASRPIRKVTSSSTRAAATRGCSSSTRTARSSARSARASTDSSSRTRCASIAQDNIWAVDEGTNMVIKFNPEGRVVMVLGRRPEAVEGARGRPPARRRRRQSPTCSAVRPTSDGMPQGNIFVSDGYGNSRVVKFDKNGRFIKQVGQRSGERARAVQPAAHDGDGRAGQRLRRRSRQRARPGVRQRSQRSRRSTTTSATRGRSASRRARISTCSSRTRFPTTALAQYRDITGEIYKMELDGTIIGKFGKAGKQLERVQHGPRDRLPESRTSCSSRKSPRGACRRSCCSRSQRTTGDGDRCGRWCSA